MRVVITGATGLVGTLVAARLRADGHEVQAAPRPWVMEAFEGADAVVHLAGESLAARWTDARKQRIRQSRVEGTTKLSEILGNVRPRVWLSASAVGWYGDRGDEVLDERSPPGTGFLADVCREWEAAARVDGARVVNLRFGLVLSKRGGALAAMLPAFRMGVGGPIGSGRQWMSWIGAEDVAGAVAHLVVSDVVGPVNLTSPEPVTNRAFVGALGRTLGRPAVVPLPAFAVRVLFGEMGEATLLAGQRVEPRRLVESGYVFRQAGIDAALGVELGREGPFSGA